jgi:hypothetical protein
LNLSRGDVVNILLIFVISVIFLAVYKLIESIKPSQSDVFDFERDHREATNRQTYRGGEMPKESTHIGISQNRRNVFISNDAKHVFVCGTTGSGKTIALSNFLSSGAEYNYPMLIVDGKGDTDDGSLLEITKKLCPNRRIYVINLNDPKASDKYNPFKNTNTDVIKDMLINMTHWSEEHYKYNTERYVQRLCKLLALREIEISLESLTNYLPTINFNKLRRV